MFLEPIETTTAIVSPTINGDCARYTGSGHFSSRVTGVSSKIFGGNDANPGDLPWQVLFDNNKCGGTLVSLQVSSL